METKGAEQEKMEKISWKRPGLKLGCRAIRVVVAALNYDYIAAKKRMISE
jgi:hypothetical protein